MTVDNVGRVIDQWSFLDYKETFANMLVSSTAKSGNNAFPLPNSWVGGDNWRRCTAYELYESYYRNAARAWMNPEAEDDDKTNRREYGDAFVITEMILSSLLGNDQKIFIQEAIEATEESNNPAKAQLDKLDEWALKEKLKILMNEEERDAIKLGDGVYVLGWDPEVKRPRLRVFNPGFYFPVLDEKTLDGNGWPTKVHIAYEYERVVNDQKKVFVRRMTWELKDIPGNVKRRYKWGDKAIKTSCFYTDGTWELSDIEKGEVQDFSAKNGVYAARDEDLQLDFIPVVHIPHFASGSEHFGISALGPLLQVFDDIHGCDTDLSLTSGTTGSPPIAIHGANLLTDSKGRIPSYGPRTVFNTGEGGAELLDTSQALDALLKYRESLNDLMSVNSRVPKTLMGRVDPSKVPSGIVLTLSFSPHSGLIRHLRLLREDKYSLLLKFVSRMFWADGQLEEIFDASIKFGSYLPADKQEVMTLVQTGISGHVISLDTAVLMLIEAGFPIEDAKEEVAKIIEKDYKSAGELVDATGDIQAARDLLGLGPIPEPGGAETEGNQGEEDIPSEGLPNPTDENIPPVNAPPAP